MSLSTVLLLESDDLSIERMSAVLSSGPFQVVHAYSFKEAFEKVKTSARDLSLVILDFELATDDVDVFERLRKLDFDRPLPVLLMGQVPLSEAEISQLKADSGYAGYIYKTMPDAEMLTRISALVKSEQDRRHSPRVFFATRVHGIFNERNYIADMYTINRNGAFLKLNGALPPQGTKGQITFNVSLSEKMPLRQDVEVVYLRQHDPNVVSIYPAGIGVKFINLNPQSVQLIEDLVGVQVAQGQVFSDA